MHAVCSESAVDVWWTSRCTSLTLSTSFDRCQQLWKASANWNSTDRTRFRWLLELKTRAHLSLAARVALEGARMRKLYSAHRPCIAALR